MPANSRWDLIQRLNGLKLLKNPGNGRLNNLNGPSRPQCVNMSYSFLTKISHQLR